MGADRLGAKGPTCGTELHIRTGAGKRERLRTTRGVVGHGHGACQRAFGLGLEGHGDRATGPWIHSRAASVRLRDRKSTRLNSSHLGISYAVFCLKKTKII